MFNVSATGNGWWWYLLTYPPIWKVSLLKSSDLDGIFAEINRSRCQERRRMCRLVRLTTVHSVLLRLNPSQEGIASVLRSQTGLEWELEEK